MTNSCAAGDLDPGWINANVPEGYTVVTVGDIIMAHPMFQQMKRHADSKEILDLLASADLVVGNFEGTILDLNRFEGHAEGKSGFGWLISAPACAKDLKDMGFDMLSRANNHTLDWGVKGMQMTDELLRAEGLAIAGSGSGMSAARAPAYVNGDKARASLVSLTSTFESNFPAMDGLGQINSRPGASTLGTTAIAIVSQVQFDQLKAIRDALMEGMAPDTLVAIDDKRGIVTLFGKQYKVGGTGIEIEDHYLMDAQDLQQILLNVRQARQTSDFTILACHAHEPGNWVDTPPDFLPELARRAIDESGADMVCGHGPHQLRGIEIHGGKPIFYSLANFCFMENVRGVLPRDEWERRAWKYLDNAPDLDPTIMTAAEFMEWQRVHGIFKESCWYSSVIAVTTYGLNGFSSIRLIPVGMRWSGRDAERGLPRVVKGSDAKKILMRLKELSKPFGTEVMIIGDEGVIIRVVPPLP